jgi:hypothetical protein
MVNGVSVPAITQYIDSYILTQKCTLSFSFSSQICPQLTVHYGKLGVLGNQKC